MERETKVACVEGSSPKIALQGQLSADKYWRGPVSSGRLSAQPCRQAAPQAACSRRACLPVKCLSQQELSNILELGQVGKVIAHCVRQAQQGGQTASLGLVATDHGIASQPKDQCWLKQVASDCSQSWVEDSP